MAPLRQKQENFHSTIYICKCFGFLTIGASYKIIWDDGVIFHIMSIKKHASVQHNTNLGNHVVLYTGEHLWADLKSATNPISSSSIDIDYDILSLGPVLRQYITWSNGLVSKSKHQQCWCII